MSRTDWRKIKNRYAELSPHIQRYFKHLPKIMGYTEAKVALLYLFSVVELVQIETLYLGICRNYNIDASLTWQTINSQFINHNKFQELFGKVFGIGLDKEMLNGFDQARLVRNSVVHGKGDKTYAEQVDAVIQILNFSQQFDLFVKEKSGFSPFSNKTGVTSNRKRRASRGESIPILKKLGFKLA